MEIHGETAYELLSSDALKKTPVDMSSGNKENGESSEKKKKSRPRLSIKIFSSGNKKKDGAKKVTEECHSPEASYKMLDKLDGLKRPATSVKADPVLDIPAEPQDDVSESDKPSKVVHQVKFASNSSKIESKPVGTSPTFKAARMRSLSAIADVQVTKIKLKGNDKKDGGKERKRLVFKEEDTCKKDGEVDKDKKEVETGEGEEREEDEESEEEEEDDQLSPLPSSPSKSCLRGRSATFGYAGEVVETTSRPRSVSFAPDTVDPPPRSQMYRAWVESRTRPPVNIKHEKHKQKMNLLKKVNMADYLSSTRKTAGGSGMMSSSSSSFGGGGMMM